MMQVNKRRRQCSALDDYRTLQVPTEKTRIASDRDRVRGTKKGECVELHARRATESVASNGGMGHWFGYCSNGDEMPTLHY